MHASKDTVSLPGNLSQVQNSLDYGNTFDRKILHILGDIKQTHIKLFFSSSVFVWNACEYEFASSLLRVTPSSINAQNLAPFCSYVHCGIQNTINVSTEQTHFCFLENLFYTCSFLPLAIYSQFVFYIIIRKLCNIKNPSLCNISSYFNQ